MKMRNRIYRKTDGAVLFANLLGTKEAEDAYHKINLGGFGRIRSFQNFQMHIDTGLVVQRKFVRLNSDGKKSSNYSSQVFQVGGCPLRCRYCFVDSKNLNGTNPNSRFFLPADIVQMFLTVWPDIRNLDISGGSPDLCPEFVFELLREIELSGLYGKITVWVESNLDMLYYSRLPKEMIRYIAAFPNLRFLCSIKGWDNASVRFNTRYLTSFDKQIEGLKFLNLWHIPLSLYLTFIGDRIPELDDIINLYSVLNEIHNEIPERCIPLYIKRFHAQGDTGEWVTSTYYGQERAAKYWDKLISGNCSTAAIYAPALTG